MRHRHVGPMSVACTLCFVELKQDEAVQKRETARRERQARRFWRAVRVFFIALAIGGLIAATWFMANRAR